MARVATNKATIEIAEGVSWTGLVTVLIPALVLTASEEEITALFSLLSRAVNSPTAIKQVARNKATRELASIFERNATNRSLLDTAREALEESGIEFPKEFDLTKRNTWPKPFATFVSKKETAAGKPMLEDLPESFSYQLSELVAEEEKEEKKASEKPEEKPDTNTPAPAEEKPTVDSKPKNKGKK